jgi:hypothetical protein
MNIAATPMNITATPTATSATLIVLRHNTILAEQQDATTWYLLALLHVLRYCRIATN